jgi:uncharacterized protein (DUF433 family)
MAKEQPTYHDRIIQDPKIMVGKPVIKGTRIPVDLVLGYLAEKPADLEELFADYPDLTEEDVKAVLEYARHAVSQQSTPGSPWLRDLYEYFAPVREDIRKRGISEAELHEDIDAAVRAVREEHA